GSPHSVHADFTSDTGDWAPSSGDLTPGQTVTAASSSTEVSSDNNPSVFGSSVTFSATVGAGAGSPTGSVVFTIDGTAGSPVAVNGAGVATTSTSALSVSGSPHSVHAAFTSDTGDWAPSSGDLSPGQTVTAAGRSTVVSSDNNPSVFGESVTFSATVSSGAGVPTGSVVFTVDG